MAKCEICRAKRKRTVTEVYLLLLLVRVTLACFDLRRVLAIASNFYGKRSQACGHHECDDAISEVCRIYGRAVYFHFGTVACVPRALTIFLLALDRGITARFVIGVRKTPFLSHAWVEAGGTVLTKDAAFASRLLPIYTIG